MTTERLEAIGPRGEACIIIRTLTEQLAPAAEQASATAQATYRLASGERLKVGDGASTFEMLDGSRRFTLR